MSDIDELVHRYNASAVTDKRLAMLQSMLLKYPTAKLVKSQVGFGVWLEGNRYLDVLRSSGWTNTALIDWLDVFVSLLLVDPAILGRVRFPDDGQSFEATVRQRLFPT